MRPRRKFEAFAYLFAIAATGAALLLRFSLDGLLGGSAAHLAFVASVMAAAWWGGVWPGLLATLLGALAGEYFFMEPRYTLLVEVPAQQLEVLIFAIVGVLVSLFIGALHTEVTDRKHAEEALRQRAEELQTLLDTLPVGVFIAHDPDCRRITGNAAGHSGLGIGLTLVQSLVEMHGGRIEVHSDGPGLGSEFCVRLPVMVDTPFVGPELGQPEEQQSPPNARCRVLVVDDSKAAADMLGMTVRSLGCEVRTASDGQDAIEVAAEFLPQLVIMDIGMPKMDGCKAARAIREQDWGRKMMLVALTGWGQEEDRMRTQAAGFDQHFVKPMEPKALRKLLLSVQSEAV